MRVRQSCPIPINNVDIIEMHAIDELIKEAAFCVVTDIGKQQIEVGCRNAGETLIAEECDNDRVKHARCDAEGFATAGGERFKLMAEGHRGLPA
jgi:hypothetical protein